MTSPSTVCFVQVNNVLPYMSLFLAHHERLFDKIVIVVHNSGKDIPNNSDEVRWFSLAEYGFYQPIAWNFLYEREGKGFDFAFFLDADELLSVTTAGALQSALAAHKYHCGLYLYWRPVIPPKKFSGRLDAAGVQQFTVSSELAHTRKMVYNTKKTVHFSAAHGNHVYNGKKSLLSLFRAEERRLCLLHIPFLSLTSFQEKVANNPKDEFLDKFIRTSRTLREKYGDDWYQSELTDTDFIYFCLNYRERDERKHMRLEDVDFMPFPDLGIPEDRVSYWFGILNSLPSWERRTAPRTGEMEWIEKIKRQAHSNSSDFRNYMRETDRELRFVISY
ncbi:hypothetical protein ACU5AY_04795 [Rhizobium sp. PAMB 3174]